MTLESRNRKNKKHNPHGPRGERCSTPTRFNQPDPSTRLDFDPSALPLPPLLPYYPLHPSVHSTAASLPPAPYRAPPVRSAATPTQHDTTPFRHQFAPTLYPMSTKAAPAGRRLTSAQRDSLDDTHHQRSGATHLFSCTPAPAGLQD